MATWYTPTTAALATDLWADADTIDPPILGMLLDVARDQVLDYAPARTTPPTGYVFAQLRQAQNLYRASVADAGGNIGDPGTFAITPRPLDWHVKALLRPNRGRPRVR